MKGHLPNASRTMISFFRPVGSFLFNKIEDYFANSSIQGLRYITEPKKNITERIFWIAVCLLATFATYRLFMGSLRNFREKPISFGVDTSYLMWNTTFPAFSVCQYGDTGKIKSVLKRLYGEKYNEDIEYFMKDVAFWDGDCNSCSKYCGKTLNCTDDLNSVAELVKSPCKKLLKKCKWNNEAFDCCKEFLPLQTEIGLCYTFNSILTEKNESDETYISNRLSGPGRLEFQAFQQAQMFIHSREDVPYINAPAELKTFLREDVKVRILFTVTEIQNDPLVEDIPQEKRNCRFPWENDLIFYDVYSYSTCITECRAKAEIKRCNCTSHFVPEVEGIKRCGVKGLACIEDHWGTLQHLSKSNDSSLICDCIPSCVEPDINIVWSATEMFLGDADEELKKRPSMVSVQLQGLPSLRYRRNVVRSSLDLVVSIGGAAGLFMGASLLSLAELLIFMLLRSKRVPTTQLQPQLTFTGPHLRLWPDRGYSTYRLPQFLH